VFRKEGEAFAPASPSPGSPETRLGAKYKLKNERRRFKKC
jgi:hypothetical protein